MKRVCAFLSPQGFEAALALLRRLGGEQRLGILRTLPSQ
jgi:hypothetical protein